MESYFICAVGICFGLALIGLALFYRNLRGRRLSDARTAAFVVGIIFVILSLAAIPDIAQGAPQVTIKKSVLPCEHCEAAKPARLRRVSGFLIQRGTMMMSINSEFVDRKWVLFAIQTGKESLHTLVKGPSVSEKMEVVQRLAVAMARLRIQMWLAVQDNQLAQGELDELEKHQMVVAAYIYCMWKNQDNMVLDEPQEVPK